MFKSFNLIAIQFLLDLLKRAKWWTWTNWPKTIRFLWCQTWRWQIRPPKPRSCTSTLKKVRWFWFRFTQRPTSLRTSTIPSTLASSSDTSDIPQFENFRAKLFRTFTWYFLNFFFFWNFKNFERVASPHFVDLIGWNYQKTRALLTVPLSNLLIKREGMVTAAIYKQVN